MLIIHVTSIFGTSERHSRARDSWSALYENGVVPLWFNGPVHLRRTSDDIGDHRHLPYFNDMLHFSLDMSSSENDVIFWCNDDVILDPRIQDWLTGDVLRNEAMSMRRFEPERPDEVHIGRELFGFTKAWLNRNLAFFPDFLTGCPCFDIVLAAIIRKEKGIDSTLDNMLQDFPDCDSVERHAIHHHHPSAWAGKNEYKYPGNNHNRRLAKEWCSFHMPSLQL